jgi:thiol-disulfide isomerase/thioredoxin
MRKSTFLLTAIVFWTLKVTAQSTIAIGTKIDDLKFSDHILNVPANTDFNTKFKVLEFWATWCAPCLKAVPHLNELNDAFVENKDLVFLSITYEKPEVAQRALKRIPFKTMVVADQNQQIFENLGVKNGATITIPQTFLVDKNNVVRWKGKPSELTNELINKFLSGSI